MGFRTDDAKGRVKEAAGDLTKDDDLKREGKLDQAGAKVKEKVDQAKDKADELVDKGKEKVDELMDDDR